MNLQLFRAFLGVDLLIASIVAAFFLIGLTDGSVGSDNIGIWFGIFSLLAVLIAGGLWLKRVGHPVIGSMLLLVLAIPGILYGVFLVLFMATNTPWV